MNKIKKTKDNCFPLVSLVTINYNGDQYLEECIKSVINQNYKKIQYIIIDGGSTDKSVEIVNKYRDFVDIFISEKDNGISDAFNKGIMRSKGQIVGLLNSDDVYNEFAVEQVVESYLINKCNAGIYFGDILYFDNTNKFGLKADSSKLWKYMSIFHPATFVTKNIYDKLGGYSEEYKYAMDCEFIHRCLYNNVPFIHISHTLTNFRLAGTSDKNYLKAYKEFYRSVKKYNYHISAEFYFLWGISKKYILHSKVGSYLGKRRHLFSWILFGKNN